MSKLIDLGKASRETKTVFARCRSSKLQDNGTNVSAGDDECDAQNAPYCVIVNTSTGATCTQD